MTTHSDSFKYNIHVQLPKEGCSGTACALRPSLPAPAQSWCGTTPGKTKSTCLTTHQAFKGTEVGQDTLSAEHRHRRSPQFSPEATAPTPALDREGWQPPSPRELWGKPGATQEQARMWISAAGWPEATSFPLQPSLVTPITLSCPFPSRLRLWQRKQQEQQQGLRCPHMWGTEVPPTCPAQGKGTWGDGGHAQDQFTTHYCPGDELSAACARQDERRG